MKNKKILVFGSSGFLGNHLVKSLIKKNEVIEFDIIPPRYKHKNTTFIRGSILDKTLVAKAMKGVDIVYHFAAMTDLDTVNRNPATAIEINIAGTSNILDSCIEEKIQRLIFSSSVYVYSKTGGIYKSTKQACELLIKDYDKMHGLNYTILQLGSVYGPNSTKKNLISRLIIESISGGAMKHYGTGNELRQYIYIKDVVNAAIESLNKKYNKQKVILIGIESISISELMDKIISLLGKDIKKFFSVNKYNIHYKTSPFDIDLDSAIFFNIKSPTNLNSGLINTINSINEHNNKYS
tara:strand:- start:3344 stop:4228 length:885 start_codon:yes stop_codon:yes gene_type:complete